MRDELRHKATRFFEILRASIGIEELGAIIFTILLIIIFLSRR